MPTGMSVPFTAKRRGKVRALLDEMWALDGAADVARSHETPARCRGCGVREGVGRRGLCS